MPYTRGFVSPALLNRHFHDHGADFAAATPQEYEGLADAFLGGPLTPTALSCARRRGDIVRYDPTTQEFGVLSSTGVIRTYFKPDPAIHGYATNYDYFLAECAR